MRIVSLKGVYTTFKVMNTLEFNLNDVLVLDLTQPLSTLIFRPEYTQIQFSSLEMTSKGRCSNWQCAIGETGCYKVYVQCWAKAKEQGEFYSMWQKGSADSAIPGRVDTMFKLAVLFVRNSVWQGPGHFDSVCDRKPNRQVEGLKFKNGIWPCHRPRKFGRSLCMGSAIEGPSCGPLQCMYWLSSPGSPIGMECIVASQGK